MEIRTDVVTVNGESTKLNQWFLQVTRGKISSTLSGSKVKCVRSLADIC